VYSLACAEAGIEPLTGAAYWRKRRGGSSTFDLHPLAGAARAAFQAAWLGSIEDRDYLAYDHVYRGVPDSLSRLAGAGHRLVLVTLRRCRPALLAQLDSLGLGVSFEAVVSPLSDADQDKGGLIARAGYSPGDAVVGDSEADLLAAASLSLAGIAVTSGVRSGRFLTTLAPAVLLGSLRELSPSVLSEAETSRRNSNPGRALS
jgi:phosphoglycolate phosphatase-like HAD superfamily hydrolase